MHTFTYDENDIVNQIIYRGEGNSSIVVALKTRAKVIRLLKKDGKIMKSSQDHHVTQHPMRSLKFIHLIMKPLTGQFLSSATELVHLKSELINVISKKVEDERPSHRLDKTLHLDDQFALVMDDLCVLPMGITRHLTSEDLCGPTISVEIKPKQGFMPIHRLLMKSTLNDQINLKLKSSCLYGLTQDLKLARGRIKEPSSYCPINLFSGCPVRMRNALEGLLHNPQNNLRIFKDLSLAYDESNQMKLSNVFENFFLPKDDLNISTTSINNSRLGLGARSNTTPAAASNEDRLIELLIQCLLNEHEDKRDGDTSATTSPLRDTENSFAINDSGCSLHNLNSKCKRCDITHPSSKKHKSITNNHELPQSCVLASVLRAQRLDSIGAHEAKHMLDWLLEESRYNGLDILEELSKPRMPKGFGSHYQLPGESKHEYYFRKVWEFLVSLTAKDCSIIITIRRLSPNRYESIVRDQPMFKKHLLREQRTGAYFMFNVGIADLDQKMPLKIPRICDHINQIISTKIK